MLFDDPACFRLDRIPVRPIHWLWRPIRPCRTAPDDADEGKADRPPSRAVAALRPWVASPFGESGA